MGWDGNYFRDQSARKERKKERKGAVLFIEFSKVGKTDIYFLLYISQLAWYIYYYILHYQEGKWKLSG